jgi:hypothetical protein
MSQSAAVTLSEDFFTIPLSTFRDRNVPLSPFPYGMAISAISILFFRTTIRQSAEPNVLTWFFGLLLAFLAYSNKSYDLISAVQVFSYVVPLLLFSSDQVLAPVIFIGKKVATTPTTPKVDMRIARILLIALSAILCLVVCHFTSSGALFRAFSIIMPTFALDGLALLFPIHELKAAYHILDEFILEDGLLRDQVARLFFITFHTQVGIGYLGIDFLKREQERRNQLVRMDMTDSLSDSNDATVGSQNDDSIHPKHQENMNKKSQQFQRTAAPFIFFTAVPYMIKVIGYGNLNAFAYSCFKDDVHRAIRLYDLFEHDNNLVALSQHSAKAPAGMNFYGCGCCSVNYLTFCPCVILV